MLSSFPPDYPWTGETVKSLGSQIGNAVPPLLARAAVAALFDDEPPVCYNCGNDLGPYDGLCLDCLEELL